MLWPGLSSCLSRIRRQCELCMWTPVLPAWHDPSAPPRMPAICLPTTSTVHRRAVSPPPRQLWPSPLHRQRVALATSQMTYCGNLATVCRAVKWEQSPEDGRRLSPEGRTLQREIAGNPCCRFSRRTHYWAEELDSDYASYKRSRKRHKTNLCDDARPKAPSGPRRSLV